MKALKGLLQSRKFLVALGATVVSFGVQVLGWQEVVAQGVADKVVEVLLILGALYIGGTALEDAADKIGINRTNG